jgi:hypothetical protein
MNVLCGQNAELLVVNTELKVKHSFTFPCKSWLFLLFAAIVYVVIADGVASNGTVIDEPERP